MSSYYFWDIVWLIIWDSVGRQSYHVQIMLILSSHFCCSYILMRTFSLMRKILPNNGGRRHFSLLTSKECAWCFYHEIWGCSFFWGKPSLLHLGITILFLGLWDLHFFCLLLSGLNASAFVKMILGPLLNRSFYFSSSIIWGEKCICTVHIVKPFIGVSDSSRTWLVLHLIHVGFTSFICASFVYVPG